MTGLVLGSWGASVEGRAGAVVSVLALALGLALVVVGRTGVARRAGGREDRSAGGNSSEAAKRGPRGPAAALDGGPTGAHAVGVRGGPDHESQIPPDGDPTQAPRLTRFRPWVRPEPLLGAGALLCALGLDATPESRAADVPPGEARVEGIVQRVSVGPDGTSAVLRVVAGRRLEDDAPVPAGARVRVRLPDDDIGSPGGRARSAPREGARVRALLALRPAPGFRNPTPHPAWSGGAAVDATARTLGETGLEAVGPGRALADVRAHVRAAIADTLDPRAAGLARALVLGDGSAPVTGDAAAVRAAGLAHVLAVSGMHVTLCAGLLLLGLRTGLMRVAPIARRLDARRLAYALGAPLALLYASFAGGTPSAARAGLASSVTYGLLAAGRRPRAGPVAAVAALGLAVWAPEEATRPAYLLSVLATGALVSAPRPRTGPPEGPGAAARGAEGADADRRGGIGTLIRAALTASVRTTIATAPLVAWCFDGVPAIGVVANVMLVPFGAYVLLPLANLHALLAAVDVRLGALSAPLFELVSGAFVGAAETLATASFGTGLPPLSLTQGLLLTAACAALLLVAPRGEGGPAWARLLPHAGIIGLAALALAVAELHLCRVEAPRGVVRATFVDVGQGDATLVDLPDGSLMLVDAGGAPNGGPDPGARALLPVLRARRRQRIDVVVLSHPHPDHYGGLPALLDALPIGEIWDSGQAEAEHPEGEASQLLARAQRLGVRVRRPEELCGRPILRGGARIDVLWPCPAHDPLLGPNDNSLVVRIAFGTRSLLLAGDVEHEAEATIARTVGANARADVLKVPHHGSRTSSTPPFLAAVGPRLGVISAGLHNRFGHPHPEVVEALDARGVKTVRIDRTGGVTLVTDGRTWTARDRFGSVFWRLEP